MKLELLSITLSLFMSSTLLGNISSIENNFKYSLFSSIQDTTINDSISFFSKSNIPRDKFKSPVKAMFYSAVIPGLGQAYMGKWQRGLIYLALDGIAVGFLHKNNKLAEKRKREYEYYAAENWDFAYWIFDYYKWLPYDFDDPNSEWNAIREGFVKNTGDCATIPHCYIDIWDHSHSVNFIYKGELISSSDQSKFQPVYEELCEIESPLEPTEPNYDPKCLSSYGDIESYNVNVIEDHNFYEGIQKYDMFIAGWEDNELIEVINRGENDENNTTPHESAYQRIYSDYDQIKTLAERGGKFMFINHFVSMIDALFLAKKWNAKHFVKFNLDVYPDLSNKSGVGRVKLTMGWK